MSKLLQYDHIILDGFGTLYDKNFSPINGSSELLNLIGSKGILFSNMGSILGSELKEKLNYKMESSPVSFITSLNLLCQYIENNDIKSIYHYGGTSADNILRKTCTIASSIEDVVDAIVFTSLPQDNWIQKSQDILRYIYYHKKATVILANPDRLLPNKHVGINVGMVFDMLVNNWPSEEFKLSKIEIGKPLLSRINLQIGSKENILVIGDNKHTDGGLAKALKADLILISEYEKNNFNDGVWCYRSLKALLSEFDV